jgi:hypothetical protein
MIGNNRLGKIKKVMLGETDITHYRLTELAALADSQKPFYDWVEACARKLFGDEKSLHQHLLTLSRQDIKALILHCQSAADVNLPKLFDGKGEEYPHSKACFYFFAWIIRDAPQQRLSRLIAEYRATSPTRITLAESIAESLALLTVEYRHILKNFEWEVVREVFIDRLEGSRRAIKGPVNELIAKRGLAVALSNFYDQHTNYGRYKDYEVSKNQVKIGQHTYDVRLTFISPDEKNNLKLYIPVKTRETRGGGHSHLFSRDILEAIRALKEAEPHSLVVPLIIADDWSAEEEAVIKNYVYDLIIIRENPGTIENLPDIEQARLTNIVRDLLQQR